MALDAIEGDPEFLSRACDCRAVLQAQREQRRARTGSSASKHRATSGMSETPPPSGDASEDVDVEETAMQGVLDEEDNVITDQDDVTGVFEPSAGRDEISTISLPIKQDKGLGEFPARS